MNHHHGHVDFGLQVLRYLRSGRALPRWRLHHSRASRATSSSVPGSSNRCVAPRDNLECHRCPHPAHGLAIELDHRFVGATHNQQRRSADPRERVARQVGTAAA